MKNEDSNKKTDETNSISDAGRSEMIFKKIMRRKWLLITAGLLLFIFVGETCCNSCSDTDREEIALDKEVELHFDGRPKIGEPYLFAIKTRQVQARRLEQVEESKSPYAYQICEAGADGEIIFQSLDPIVIQFQFDFLAQTIDDEILDYSPLKGMTAIIRAPGNTSCSRLVEDDNAVSFVAGNAPEGINELLPGARRLIASMFSILLHRPEDYLGKTRIAKPGDQWKASAKPVLEALNVDRLDVSADNFKTMATYRNRLEEKGEIPAQSVFVKIESVDIPGYDYSLEVLYDFPDGGDDAPLHVERSEIKVKHRLSPDNSNSKMIHSMTTRSEVRMIRKSVLNSSLFFLLPIVPEKMRNGNLPDPMNIRYVP